MADEQPTGNENTPPDDQREAKWAKAKEDIPRHDREFENKYGKKGSK